MSPERGQQLVDFLANVPAHQLHPTVKRVLIEILEELGEFEEPPADVGLRGKSAN